MSWDPVKEAKKWINSIKNAGNSAINSVQNEARSSANWVKNQANDAKNQAVGQINSTKNQAESEFNNLKNSAEISLNKFKQQIESQGQEVLGDIENKFEELPDMMKDEALKALAEAKKLAEQLYGVISKEAFVAGIKFAHGLSEWIFKDMKEFEDNEPKIVAQLNKFGGGFSICGIKFHYSNFYKRSKILSFTLMEYTQKPPEFRRKPFLELIEAIGPDSIEVGLEASASFVVFQTQNLSLSGWINGVELEFFLLLGDKALKKLGVPE